MKNKESWKLIIQTVISILSAIATTLGLNSCLWAMSNEQWVMSLDRKCRNHLTTHYSLPTTQNSKICGHLSHRCHLRAIIEWCVGWQLTLKITKTHRNEVGFVVLCAFQCENTPSKRPIFSPFAKNAKTEYANYNNISALHFCFLHFIPPQCLVSGNLLLPLQQNQVSDCWCEWDGRGQLYQTNPKLFLYPPYRKQINDVSLHQKGLPHPFRA